jgi:hypothetical protein
MIFLCWIVCASSILMLRSYAQQQILPDYKWSKNGHHLETASDVNQVHGQYTLLHLASTIILDKALPFPSSFYPMRSTTAQSFGYFSGWSSGALAAVIMWNS